MSYGVLATNEATALEPDVCSYQNKQTPSCYGNIKLFHNLVLQGLAATKTSVVASKFSTLPLLTVRTRLELPNLLVTLQV